MSGRLAIDFGTSNTVVSVWNEIKKEGIPLHIPDFSRVYYQGEEKISVIPSLIHYDTDNRRWIGNQVFQRSLYHSNHTFRWMKRYISHRSPIKIRINDRDFSPFDAGQDFLSIILQFSAQQIDLKNEEIAFSVPVEAYEHYENWLGNVAEKSGLERFRLIDEPSAAALGYGAHIQPGNIYLIFDFGGGTLHASIILIESESASLSGRRCRVLGKSGKEIGGTSIDQWIFEKVLQTHNRRDSEEGIRKISNALLVECERAKELLSNEQEAAITVMDPNSGTILNTSFSRDQFEEILDQHDLFMEINQVIRSAIHSARERGYSEDDVQAVLMVGGSSQIPSVQKVVQQFFGKDKVKSNRPLDAVSRGAAAFIAGIDFFDHIQHDYAIRYVDSQTGQYDYRVIVPKGTPYPSNEPVAKLSVKAAYDSQKCLGLTIFEMGESRQGQSAGVELVFDPEGAARIMPITPHEQEQRSHFFMNENNPTFLKASPPARQGEARFEVEFIIDENKRLLFSSRDIISGELTHKNYPIVKLT